MFCVQCTESQGESMCKLHLWSVLSMVIPICLCGLGKFHSSQRSLFVVYNTLCSLYIGCLVVLRASPAGLEEQSKHETRAIGAGR